MYDLDRERLSRIRNGEQGIAITIYLDVAEEARDQFIEHGFWPVAIFSPEASAQLLDHLNRLPDNEAIIANDDAGFAIAHLIDAGEDRQAWLRDLIESVAIRRPRRDTPDPLAGLAREEYDNNQELRRVFESEGYSYRSGELVRETEPMSANDVVSAVEALYRDHTEGSTT
jgi:hypothetical protein